MEQRLSLGEASTLLPRILSIIVLVPFSLWIIYLGPPYSFILGMILATGLCIEWGKLCATNLLPAWSKISFMTFGTLYMFVAIIWLLHLLKQPEGWKLLFWLLFLVWSTDTAAYIGGRLLQGPKLAPSISPNKTWSGFITGMIGGTVVTYVTSYSLLPNVFNLWGIIGLVCVAQMGDLLESQAKRWSNVKDTSTLIPGHGGLLDRLDSLLAVAVTIALWQWLFLG